MQDILFDPQTPGGLLIAVSESDACKLLEELKNELPCAEQIGYVSEYNEDFIILE